MKRLWIFVAAGLVLAPALGAARPVDRSAVRWQIEELRLDGTRDAVSAGSALATGILFDTAYYGGSVWAADSNRWEALRGAPGVRARWTFNSGVGSNFTEPVRSPKPVGWHHRMEGWYGFDQTFQPQPWFRRSSECALNGSWSFWAGLSLAEAEAACWGTGRGYGNDWDMVVSRTFSYPGTGSISLAYVYRTECEPGFDYLYVEVDTTGTGAQPPVVLQQYTGALGPATANLVLSPAAGTLRHSAGPIRIRFHVVSDGAYSDEDGGFATSCGHSAVDDIQLSGAVVASSGFEGGADGWAQELPTSGPGGDWSDIRALSSLPPVASFCPCSISDSVMVFLDLTGAHNTPVNDLVVSPWLDLKAGGDVGRPGRLLLYEGAFELPVTNYIYLEYYYSWYPAICPSTGKVYTTPLKQDGFVRFGPPGPWPICTAPSTPIATDFSSVVPPSAEKMRVAIGLISTCAFFSNCTGISNATPYLDNISVGVYGAIGAPILTLRTVDVFQDNFAADGTLNPASAGRIDTNNVKGAGNPQPNTALGDTLIVNGDGGNMEVRVVFHVRPGPFTSVTALTSWAGAKWTNEPALGAGWYSARMDSAEQGGIRTAAKWMGTLHELDPKFGGGTDTDRGGEGDANQLSHDIFPDHLLTPGSRIDYFVQARYLPPDPRNPGGTYWFVTPDTTGGRYLEVEVLPSSMAADTSWNCVLYVDHHADRDPQSQSIEEQGLSAALGFGGNNREGTRYDRYDVQAPSSQQASLGRPLNTQYGATGTQVSAYRAIAWHSGNLASFNLVDEDAGLLTAWLTLPELAGNRFWGSGDGLARSMSTEAEPTTVNFLNAVCGVRFTCDTIRLASCPSGSVLDSTFCLPLTAVGGSYFTSTFPLSARGNGCPNIRSFDLLALDPSVPTARGQLSYQKSDGVRNYAAVANTVSGGGVDYKTVLDGVSVGFLRDPNGNIHNPARCDIQAPAVARAGHVLSWLQLPNAFSICRAPAGVSDGGGPGEAPRPPEARPHLANPAPNPLSGATRLAYSTTRAGERVRLEIFDVTGRLVRTLVDAALPAGPHEATWDGRDAAGDRVADGLYFARLATHDGAISRKVLVTR